MAGSREPPGADAVCRPSEGEGVPLPLANTVSVRARTAYDSRMALRRVFFAWQFAAAAVLPLWLLLGYAVFDQELAACHGRQSRGQIHLGTLRFDRRFDRARRDRDFAQ